jgi:hypothetical protein
MCEDDVMDGCPCGDDFGATPLWKRVMLARLRDIIEDDFHGSRTLVLAKPGWHERAALDGLYEDAWQEGYQEGLERHDATAKPV